MVLIDLHCKNNKTAGRLKSRAIYDKETIHGVINSALVVNVAFIDEEGLPSIVPMNGQIEEDEEGPYVLLHGALGLFPPNSEFNNLAQTSLD